MVVATSTDWLLPWGRLQFLGLQVSNVLFRALAVRLHCPCLAVHPWSGGIPGKEQTALAVLCFFCASVTVPTFLRDSGEARSGLAF